MRCLSPWISIVAILLCAGVLAKPAAADKYGLLVGVDDYAPEGESDGDLYSCETDVYLMRFVLEQKHGFAQDNVRVLLSLHEGQEATGGNIVNAFKDHLIDQAGPDDIVVFYFSGHGTRVGDTSGDEIDGYDEALCPADIDETNEVLTDDQLDFLLGQLRTEHVTVIADSCHAGTVTMAPDVVERVAKFIPFDKRFRELSVVGEVFSQYQPPSAPLRNSSKLALDQPGPEVVVAACQPWELSSAVGVTFSISDEQRQASLMTSHLCQVMWSASPQATWQEVFRALQAQMARACDYQQHAMLEGPDGQLVFSAGEPGGLVGHVQVTPCPDDHICAWAWDDGLISQLDEIAFVQRVADVAAADVYVSEAPEDSDEVRLTGIHSGGLLFVKPSWLDRELLALLQFRRTGMLTNPCPGFGASLRVAEGKTPEAEIDEALPLLEFQTTAYAYVTLFTLAPDGTVRPALVDEAVLADELYQLPSDTLPARVTFESPWPRSWGGTGVVKLIATLEPLGLDPNDSTDEPGETFLDALIDALSRLVGDPDRPDMLRCEGWTDATAYFDVGVGQW